MKVGTLVRLIQPTVQGQVQRRRINDDTDATELLIEWADANGDPQQRWFPESQLELVAAPAAEQGATA